MVRFLTPFAICCLLCHSGVTNAWGLSSLAAKETLRPIAAAPPNAEESRRVFLWKGIASSVVCLSTPTNKAIAAESVGKDPDCDDLTCLGVWDGLLADCPHTNAQIGGFLPGLPGGGAGCTSSQDDTPGIFSEPWDYSESPLGLEYSDQIRMLRPAVEKVAAKHGDTCQILIEEGRYLRVLFTDRVSSEKSVAEFYFTPNDTTVQFRIGSVVTNTMSGKILLRGSSLRNIERGEMIRKELRYLKLPVLRNRKRSLFFVESELDSFGPGSASLGPPAELKAGEITGGRLSDNVDPRLRIDA
eukprot:CAMPEP_0168247418 /NCGR_PEP_ID=MMETSP0141_2-20121125/886_1 /TAXON_ID=44445 /ORGANISM="Pseudo-nitzschia australis, Strain 10249 10 AB" /LENGTH=299 /DNA_ID=CAMNT_0008183201 /DNA_START=41 /DNA_END=937 /DNA_ORIENTATION=-